MRAPLAGLRGPEQRGRWRCRGLGHDRGSGHGFGLFGKCERIADGWRRRIGFRGCAGRPDRNISVLAMLSPLFLSGLVCLAALRSPAGSVATRISGIFVLESLVWFFSPYFSYPTDGHLDLALVTFLKSEGGYQRVLGTSGAELSPNYGSYFGVSTINYNDLPTPKITVDYIRNNLEPQVDPIVFAGEPLDLSSEEGIARASLFRRRLGAYGRAGVKFVLAQDDFESVPVPEVEALQPGKETAYVLVAGDTLAVSGQTGPLGPSSVRAVSLLVGWKDEESPGSWEVTLCSNDHCSQGSATPSQPHGQQRLEIDMAKPVPVGAASSYLVTIRRADGSSKGALWLNPLVARDEDTQLVANGLPLAVRAAPAIRFVDGALTLAHRGKSMNAYQLAGVRDYLSAGDCSLVPKSRDLIASNCKHPSRLLRLEAAMRGWRAYVNGSPTKIDVEEGAFQALSLPEGEATIEFRYVPWGFGAATGAALFGLLCLVMLLFPQRRMWARAKGPTS